MRYRPAALQFWKCFELTADGILSVAGVPRMRHHDRGCPILAFLARVGIREACSEGFRPETVEKGSVAGAPCLAFFARKPALSEAEGRGFSFSMRPLSRMHHPQPQHLLKAIEIAIPVQQFVPRL
jgi:hypothetical protein